MKSVIQINVLYLFNLCKAILIDGNMPITKHERKIIDDYLMGMAIRTLQTTNLTHILIPSESYAYNILKKMYKYDSNINKQYFFKEGVLYDSRDKRD